MDTPGFGDSSSRDIVQIQEITDVLNNQLGYTNIIMLVLEANTPRFTSGLEDMLKEMTAIFGSSWWDFVVIGVSKWEYSQAAIDDRQEICEYYPQDCRDEVWFINAFNEQLPTLKLQGIRMTRFSVAGMSTGDTVDTKNKTNLFAGKIFIGY